MHEAKPSVIYTDLEFTQTWSSDLAAEQETSVFVVRFVSLSLNHGHLMSIGKYFTIASKPVFSVVVYRVQLADWFVRATYSFVSMVALY